MLPRPHLPLSSLPFFLVLSGGCVGDVGAPPPPGGGVDAGPAAPSDPNDEGLRLELTPTALDLQVENVRSVAARVLDQNDTPYPDREVEWSTNDQDVAIVIGGRVTGVTPGSAIITARSGSLEATAVVSVSAATPGEEPEPEPEPGVCELEERNNEDSCADVYDGEDLWEAAISSEFDGREVSQVCRDIGDGPRWYTFNVGPLIDACECGSDFSSACCAEGSTTPGCPDAD